MIRLKRLLTIALVISLLSVFAISSFGSMDRAVEVSDFYFINGDGEAVNTLVGGMTLKSGCHLKGKSTVSQPFVLMTMVYEGGKLIQAVPFEDTIAFDEEKDPFNQLLLPDDVSNLRIVTYLWENLESMEPLANPAEFGGKETELYALTINGISVPLQAGKTAYELKMPYGKFEVPADNAIQAIGKDMNQKTAIINTSEFPGTVIVNTAAHDGTTKQYSIELKKEEPQQITVTASAAAYKMDRLTSTTYYSPLSGSLLLRTTGPNFGGSSTALYFQFVLSDFPENAVLESGTMDFWAKYETGNNPNEIQAFLCTGEDWSNRNSTDVSAHNSDSLSVKTDGTPETVTVDSTDYVKRTMHLDIAQLDGRTEIVVMLRMIFPGVDSKDYIDLNSAHKPTLTLNYYVPATAE